MQKEFIHIILCPSCGAGDLGIDMVCEDGREVQEGSVVCKRCKTEYAVKAGIADLLHDPSPAVMRETGAWESMRPVPNPSEGERKRSREWLRALPMLDGKEGPAAELETWRRHGRAVFALCGGEDWRGKRVLELGAGRCWASAYLARQGAGVTAVDILGDEDIGLGCGEAFLEEGVFFERVLCDMHSLPFKNGIFDAVLATATLHHSPEPERLFGEIKRVLAPEGLLIAANEPLYVPWRETPEEERKGAHEGAYPLWAWLRHLRRAGFKASEVRVGRDASLHFKASQSGSGGLVRPRDMAQAAAGYGVILALALPRLLLREARRIKAGRPMLPIPQDLTGYLEARAGLRQVNQEALAGEEPNWGPGWYPSEVEDEPFRWCGPRSRFLLPAPEEAAALVMELATFHPNPQSSPVEFEVRIGKEKAGELIVDRHGWRSYRLEVPRLTAKRPIPITLRVKRGYFVPRDMGLGEDGRRLGIACRGARWES